jgi:hypothetical protein
MTTPPSTGCTRCGAPLSGRFCTACGTPVAPPPTTPGGVLKLFGLIVGVVAVFGFGILVGREEGRRGGEATSGAPAAPQEVAPDISNLSPRERFDRLYERVMRASSSGDAATLQRFAPMAVAAYRMLDSVDADARYDVAVIKLHMGDIPGARALADSIVKAQPSHLFGHMLRFTVGRFGGDSAGAKRATAAFLANYDAEMRRARPEYAKHRTAIDNFKKQAEE